MLHVLFKVVSFRDFFFDVYICLKAAQPGNLQMSNSLSKVGIGAGLVTRDTEDTNLFSVATNVPGNQEVRKGFKICVTTDIVHKAERVGSPKSCQLIHFLP